MLNRVAKKVYYEAQSCFTASNSALDKILHHNIVTIKVCNILRIAIYSGQEYCWPMLYKTGIYYANFSRK